jgi:inner membrane transporter RhtA
MSREPIAAAAVVGGAASVQLGAALGATVFPLVGPGGVVALRQTVAAVALIAVARPRLRDLTWRSLRPTLLLGLVLVSMNLALYGAVDRIGLGLAVTLEFLGPLALALLGSRRRIDLLTAVMAGVGVVLLTGTVPGIDLVGVLFALLAAASWAAYIVLSRRVGQALPGVQGTALASLLAAVVTSPLLVMALVRLAPEELAHVLLIGLGIGVLSSALPYSIDLLVLRRLPQHLFSVLQSVQPAAAALAGLLVLGQELGVWQLVGLGLISLGNLIAVSRPDRSARTDRAARTRAANGPSSSATHRASPRPRPRPVAEG